MTNTMCTNGRTDLLCLEFIVIVFSISSNLILFKSSLGLFVFATRELVRKNNAKKKIETKWNERNNFIGNSWDFFFLYIWFAAYMMSFFKMARFDCIHQYGAAHSNEKIHLKNSKSTQLSWWNYRISLSILPLNRNTCQEKTTKHQTYEKKRHFKHHTNSLLTLHFHNPFSSFRC